MIFVNARFLTQSITGVQRYAIEISRILKKINPSIRFVAPSNILHPEIAKELNVEIIGNLKGHLWEQIELPRFLKKQGVPLLLSLGSTAPISYKRKIVTVHDLAYIHFPDAVSWKFRLYYNFLIPKVLRSSLHITSVSEFSKNDICEVYKIPREKVSVVYNASSFELNSTQVIAHKEKFILGVGSIQPYKNIEALVSAFVIFKKRIGSEYLLKLVGGSNKGVFKDTSLMKKIEENRDVQFTGYLTDTELLALYGSASCFVFPSLFEGFGIPPLEAMACGCPVIASTAASIPEVCGNAALYCDPYDVEDIAEKMFQLVNDKQLQSELVDLGYENTQRFSWQKSAEDLHDLLIKH